MLTSSIGNIFRLTIYAWTNGWINTRDAGDVRRHHTHYDVTVMVVWRYSLSEQVMHTKLLFDYLNLEISQVLIYIYLYIYIYIYILKPVHGAAIFWIQNLEHGFTDRTVLLLKSSKYENVSAGRFVSIFRRITLVRNNCDAYNRKLIGIDEHILGLCSAMQKLYQCDSN